MEIFMSVLNILLNDYCLVIQYYQHGYKNNIYWLINIVSNDTSIWF